MTWDRERYLAHCNFQYTGREFLTHMFGLLVGLHDEWASQGASQAEIDLSAFDFDSTQSVGCTINTYAITGIEPKVLEDTAEHTIKLDRMGRTTRLVKRSATIPLPLDYPVKCADDWLKIKHWYSFDESRVDVEGLREVAKRRAEGHLVHAWIPGGFDEPRQLMGEEGLCIAAIEEPELVEDIVQTMSTMVHKVLEQTLEIVTIDVLETHEDMAGKSGPLFGPKHVQRFMKPYYRGAWDMLSSAGASLFSLDSDGNINAIIESLMDCGVNFFFPLEPGSGMDIVEMRKKYGRRCCLRGGIDKYTLLGSKDDILKELEYKICDLTKFGGTIFALDHRVPNGVPIENFRYYVELCREML